MIDIRTLLENVRDGRTGIDEAILELKEKPFEDIGFAKVDLHRRIRQGAAEVIYGQGKTPEQIIGILDAMKRNVESLCARMASGHFFRSALNEAIGLLGE